MPTPGGMLWDINCTSEFASACGKELLLVPGQAWARATSGGLRSWAFLGLCSFLQKVTRISYEEKAQSWCTDACSKMAFPPNGCSTIFASPELSKDIAALPLKGRVYRVEVFLRNRQQQRACYLTYEAGS